MRKIFLQGIFGGTQISLLLETLEIRNLFLLLLTLTVAVRVSVVEHLI